MMMMMMMMMIIIIIISIITIFIIIMFVSRGLERTNFLTHFHRIIVGFFTFSFAHAVR